MSDNWASDTLQMAYEGNTREATSKLGFVFVLIYGHTYITISGVNGVIGFSSLSVHKLAIDEQLMRHSDFHIVGILLHLK